MNRRTFIESSIATAVVTATANSAWGAASVHHIDRVGLQLYTVRELMKHDFDGTVAGVAKIGYKEVEFAGYFGKTPQEVRALLDSNGLTSPSAHHPMQPVPNAIAKVSTLETNLQEIIDGAHIIGQKFLVCPYLDAKSRTADGYKRLAESCNRVGEQTKKAGIQFCYHNHSFEFEKVDGLDKLPFDYILSETDPKNVKVEMDLCWITVGGQDPIAYFNKYPGRFPLVHVKDWSKEGSDPGGNEGAVGHAVAGHIANVGSGSIDWKNIFAHSGKAGIEHYFVENDEAKSLADPQASYEYLSKLQF
ncbi:MAG: sugar phosphate isomerase/epimerase [Candidatus Acidiferrum sp.]|jgi:sugar phosphate isomerase/epimerase